MTAWPPAARNARSILWQAASTPFQNATRSAPTDPGGPASSVQCWCWIRSVSRKRTKRNSGLNCSQRISEVRARCSTPWVARAIHVARSDSPVRRKLREERFSEGPLEGGPEPEGYVGGFSESIPGTTNPWIG